MNDLLLEVIAAKGEVTLNEFEKSLNYLYSRYLTPDIEMKYIKRNFALSMEELGYCEIDFIKGKLFCCNPAIVLLPGAGLKRAFWTGARTRDTLEELVIELKKISRDLNIEVIPQDHSGIPFPKSVVIESPSIELLNRVAGDFKFQFYEKAPLSWTIANLSGSIREYEESLLFEPQSKLNWYSRTFDIEKLAFEKEKGGNSDPELREYTNPVTQQKIHIWNKQSKSAYVDREWGRYLVLKYMDTNVLIYDERARVLAVPSYVPLPRLLARAVAMCSGRLSQRIMIKSNISKNGKDISYEVYPGVTNKIAELVAKKVGQRLSAHSFSFSDKEEARC